MATMKKQVTKKINSLDLLNAAQKFMIDFANKKGINLQDDFKTVDDFKTFVIGYTFKTLRDIGIETDEAFDLVFGDGAYDKLADDVWNAANAR